MGIKGLTFNKHKRQPLKANLTGLFMIAVGVMGITPTAFSDIHNDSGTWAADVQCVGRTADLTADLVIRSKVGDAHGDLELCEGNECTVLETVRLQVTDPDTIQIQCANCDVGSPMNILGTISLDHSKAQSDVKNYTLPATFKRDPELWGIPLPLENALSCSFKTTASATNQSSTSSALDLEKKLETFLDTPRALMNRAMGIDDEENEQAQEETASPSVKAQLGANKNLIVCIQGNGLVVRSSSLTQPLFDVFKGEKLKINKNKGVKTRTLRKERHEFVNVTFPRLKKSGWMSKAYIRAEAQCGKPGTSGSPVQSKPSTSTQRKQEPVRRQAPKETPSIKVQAKGDFAASACARSIILSAAKKSVKKRWGNRSYGGGLCALGVRLSLQASGVGGLSGGIGNAVDFKRRLTEFGYVDTGIRDIKKAPVGAVIVLDGPKTSTYLRTGRMRRPYGNYVGHVTIKGDDGFWYTDGRTPEVAIGWSNDRNVRKIRNVIAVMIPGNSLSARYTGRCR